MTKSIKEKKLENHISNNKTKNKKKVVVGLSGGVDSSLSAALLLDDGWEVEGLTLWLMEGKGSCCTEGLVDAAGLCEDLGINHHIIDSRDSFRKQVIENTLEGYKEGITPLPCSMCNKNVKFEKMLSWAKQQKDFTNIATGHYARIKKSTDFDLELPEIYKYNKYLLLRGIDNNKDQSYFLYSISQEVLSRLIFPLGFLQKEETRKEATRLGLRTAAKPESQDLCLVDHYGSMNKFIDKHLEKKKGEIVHTNGDILGNHEGIQHFTVGQRKGLGIAWSEPLYVSKLDKIKNIVYVAGISDLMEGETHVKDVNWVSIKEPSKEIKVEAQIRYRSKPVKGTLLPIKNHNKENNLYKLIFDEKQQSITPGQAAVFYYRDILLGGGIITQNLS